MRAAAVVLLVWAAGAAYAAEPKPAATPAPPSSCVTCHAELDGAAAEPARHAADDVHFHSADAVHSIDFRFVEMP